jgi:hypothetical protein
MEGGPLSGDRERDLQLVNTREAGVIEKRAHLFLFWEGASTEGREVATAADIILDSSSSSSTKVAKSVELRAVSPLTKPSRQNIGTSGPGALVLSFSQRHGKTRGVEICDPGICLCIDLSFQKFTEATLIDKRASR